ncbi:cellulose synthase catalytic subunit [Jatrophihabitans telluris]|uniref:Cellulose synthase catalytic subunit n=1 Tax=Jatrophihabitans telluris TaxID=2038343 RepID=A0ABY4R2X3_9ACTN|nr:cellulose synthase catalytic subunit [Jatrophihabitans telluris]UQX90266.1 cellulose synthase catalytic subunit [Jatrophihabitans telluris]
MTLMSLRKSGPDLSLPSPPTDEEKYWYMGRQHRWLLLVQALALGLVVFSISRFALTRPALWFFLAPATLYTGTSVMSLLSSGRKKRTSRLDHELRVLEYDGTDAPTVDVFLPTAGEPLEVLDNTYRYVADLDWYTTVRVIVHDDAAREEVRELAQAYGFDYLVRPNRGELKKAGALKYMYERSSGDLICIFDADFVPRFDYLHETVPYFGDPTVGIVQTPQFFDTDRRMNWLQRCAGATQELFYRFIQPSRDRSKAAICVGTCAIYRRSALQQAGGFAQIGHSEDVHTGVKLMKAGFHLRYVPILVSKGLCPDSLLGFLNQQYRWCTGSMSLLADRSFHKNPIFSVRQRLCFWSGFMYYISTAVNIFVAPLPGLIMLFFFPQHIFPHNTVWLLGAIALWYFILPTMMKSNWRLDVLRVQQLYSFAHAVAIVHILTGRTKEWVATGTANTKKTPLALTISRVMRVTVFITQALLWTAITRATLEYGIGHTWAMLCFALVSAYLQIPMLFMRASARPAKAKKAAGTERGDAVRVPTVAAYRPPRRVSAPRPVSVSVAASTAADPALARR